MRSQTYCDPCFVRLGTPESIEDEWHLTRLIGVAIPNGQRIHKTGLCARCGQVGRVVCVTRFLQESQHKRGMRRPTRSVHQMELAG